MQAAPPINQAVHQEQSAAQRESGERSIAVSGAARTQSPSLGPPSNALSPTAAKSRADHFIGIAKKYEQESRGCRVSERGSSGGPMSSSSNGSPNKPLRGLQSRIAASNKKATQKEILSLKALERALELKVSLLHQNLSNPAHSGGIKSANDSGRSTPSHIIEEIATNCSSLPARRSRVNYLENMIKPHLEVARLVESIVMKYNSVAVHWLKGADSGVAGGDMSASSSSLKSNSKTLDSESMVGGGDSSSPGVDDALGMLLEAAKFLQPPILQLLEYEKAAAKHVLTTVSSLESAKEEIVNQFAARRLRSRMVYGDEADGHEEDDLMFMEADVKRPMRVPQGTTGGTHQTNNGANNDDELEVDETGLTNEDREDMATLANAMPIPDTAKQNSLLHSAGVRFRKLYKIVAENEEALLRDMIYRDSCYSSGGGGGETQASTTGSVLLDSTPRPPTAISLVVSPAEVATVLGQDAVNTAWYDNPVQSALMGSYLCNKTPQADLHKALRRLQSMDLAQLYLLGLKQDDPTLISTALDGGSMTIGSGSGHHQHHNKVETNTTSSVPHARGGGSAAVGSLADTYQGQLFRALGVFMSPSEKGPFVNPVAVSNLYFTFPMLHNANGPGHAADDPELADLTLAVSRIVGSVVLRLRATTLNNIACVLRRKGELQQAISFVHAAIQLEERGHLLISALASSSSHIGGKNSGGSRPSTAQGRDQKNLSHSLSQVNIDVSPHDPTSFLSSVLNQLKGGSDTDEESVWGQSTALASITNLSAMYGQIGRYQEAATHAKKAVILFQQQNALLLRNPPGTEASTIFPLSSSGTNGNPIGIGASQLEGGGRPSSTSISNSLLQQQQQQQQKKPKSSGIVVGLGAVIYHNLAMALEPSDPEGCVQAYNTALRLAINDLGGEWSPASIAIKNNRNQYLQWLDRRRGVAKLIQGATPPASAPKVLRSRSASPIGLGSGMLSPRPPSGRGTTSSSLRPSSSRTYASQKAPMSAGRRGSRGSSAPPVAPSGPSVIVRNTDGTHAFDFSEVKQSDLLLLNAEDDADNADLVSEVVAPFLGSESPLSLPDLQRLRVLNAKIQTQLRETGVVDLDTFTVAAGGSTTNATSSGNHPSGGTTSSERPAGGSRSPVFNMNVSLSGEDATADVANRRDPRPPRPSSSLIHASGALCESSDVEVTFKSDSRKPPRAPQPPPLSTSSLNASPPPSARRVSVSVTNYTMEEDSHSLREPAFSLLIETQTSLLRTGDLLNSELANNLMVSTLANINSSSGATTGARNNNAPQPPAQKQSSPSRQLKPRFTRGNPRGGVSLSSRTDPSRRGRQHHGGGDGDHDHDDQVLSGYIKEPKAPQSLPKEFFNEVKKGDELVQFFATRLNNLLRIEEVVESRYKRALTVQCAWRAYVARGRAERLRKHRESKTVRLACRELKATNTIVSFFRTLTERRRQINKEKQDSKLEKLRRLAATIVFQKNSRRWLAVQQVGRLRRQRGRFLASVFKVQQQAKKWLAVQCCDRARIAQDASRKQHKIDCERTAAATKIQACFRSHWARIAVCYIKGDYKGAMMRNRRAYRDWAARLLQRNVRGYLVRKTTHQELTDRRTVRHNKARTAMRLRAALKISSVWRGFFVRKFKQKDLHRRIQHAREVRLYELQFQSVLVLQRAVRCMMAKNELKRRKAQRRSKYEASRGMSFEVVPIPLY